MKRREYREKKEELLKALEALEKVNIEEDGFDKPDFGESFFYLTDTGSIVEDTWTDTHTDYARLCLGNLFKNKEDAEFQLERLKVLAELQPYTCKFERDLHNYNFYYDHIDEKLRLGYSNFTQHANINFRTEELAKEAKEAVGEDRIKKHLFYVTD